MIERISLKNFKAYDSIAVDFRPLTVLIGPNNSGKSSLLSSLRILSQTLQSYDQSVGLLLNGQLGDFGTYKDIVHGNNRKRRIEFTITTRPHRPTGRTVIRHNNLLSMRLKYYYRSKIHELVLDEIEIFENDESIFMSKYSEKPERHIVQSVMGKEVPLGIRSFLSANYRLFHFLPSGIMIMDEKTLKDPEVANFYTKQVGNILREIGRICRDAYTNLYGIEYLGAMRVPPERTYLFSGERNRRVGSKGENTSSILVMDSLRRGEKSKEIKGNVVRWLRKAGLAGDIQIKSLSDRHYELYLQNPRTEEFQNYADVGYGNSQVIPVLVAGYNLRAGETLIVEEPEIHLHPNAQADLGDFFLELVQQNKHCILETHSEYLVVRLQQHLAAGRLRPDQIVFYYVYAADGKKQIKQINVNSSGSFIDPWPEGFFPQRLKEATTLAKLRGESRN